MMQANTTIAVTKPWFDLNCKVETSPFNASCSSTTATDNPNNTSFTEKEDCPTPLFAIASSDSISPPNPSPSTAPPLGAAQTIKKPLFDISSATKSDNVSAPLFAPPQTNHSAPWPSQQGGLTAALPLNSSPSTPQAAPPRATPLFGISFTTKFPRPPPKAASKSKQDEEDCDKTPQTISLSCSNDDVSLLEEAPVCNPAERPIMERNCELRASMGLELSGRSSSTRFNDQQRTNDDEWQIERDEYDLKLGALKVMVSYLKRKLDAALQEKDAALQQVMENQVQLQECDRRKTESAVATVEKAKLQATRVVRDLLEQKEHAATKEREELQAKHAQEATLWQQRHEQGQKNIADLEEQVKTQAKQLEDNQKTTEEQQDKEERQATQLQAAETTKPSMSELEDTAVAAPEKTMADLEDNAQKQVKQLESGENSMELLEGKATPAPEGSLHLSAQAPVIDSSTLKPSSSETNDDTSDDDDVHSRIAAVQANLDKIQLSSNQARVSNEMLSQELAHCRRLNHKLRQHSLVVSWEELREEKYVQDLNPNS